MSKVLMHKIQGYVKEGKYNNALYSTLCSLFPDMAPSKEDVCNNTCLINYLSKVYSSIPRYLNKEPLLKATYLITIASSLNNKVAVLFIPEYIKEIRTCINLQKIALAYLKRAIVTLNKESCMIPFERVNDINYLLNLLELNLYIIVLADKSRLYENKDVINRLKVVNQRLIALIQHDPNPEYYRLQSLLMYYLGELENAHQAAVNSVKAIYLKNSFSNIDKLEYKLRYTGKLHPMVVYT